MFSFKFNYFFSYFLFFFEYSRAEARPKQNNYLSGNADNKYKPALIIPDGKIDACKTAPDQNRNKQIIQLAAPPDRAENDEYYRANGNTIYIGKPKPLKIGR